MKKYLTDAISSSGYVDKQRENLTDIHRIYFFKNAQDHLRHALMTLLYSELKKQNTDIELIYGAKNIKKLAGLILRSQGIAFLSGETPPEGAVIIDFKEAYIYEKRDKIKIDLLNKEINEYYQSAYAYFNEALNIHDEWEKIYIENMNFEKADALKDKVISAYFNAPQKETEGKVTKRFFGGATAEGYCDFVPELTKGLKRYLIKGRAGTGKSTLMRAVAQHTIDRGYDTEIYHCGFDPNSVDMVLIPELGCCIFDATTPHVYDPTEETDVVIDTYEAFVHEGTDEKYKEEIEKVQSGYKHKIKEAVGRLKQAEHIQSELNEIHDKALEMNVAIALLSKIK